MRSLNIYTYTRKRDYRYTPIQKVISKLTRLPRRISCEMVGNVSFVMVNVYPTLNTKGAQEARNTRACLSKWLPFGRNGVLEKFWDDSVTLDANSMTVLKIKNAVTARGTSVGTKNGSTMMFSLIDTNKAKRMMIHQVFSQFSQFKRLKQSICFKSLSRSGDSSQNTFQSNDT